MKNLIPLIFIFISLFASAQSRTMTEKDARLLMENVWASLKTSDSAEYLALGIVDSPPYPYNDQPFTLKEAMKDFNEMKHSVANSKSVIDHVEIKKCEGNELRKGEYYVIAWFVQDQNSYIGFGFYFVNKNDKWLIRFSAGRTFAIMNR